MKLGNTWYCMTKACSQPAYGEGWCIGNHCQRVVASHAAHHSIASSTLLAPMKNSSRCGASARRAADSGVGDETAAVSMAPSSPQLAGGALIQVRRQDRAWRS